MHLRTSKAGFVAMVLTVVAALAIAACGSSSKKTTSSTSPSSAASSGAASSGSGSSSSTPTVTASSFTNDFSAMSQLVSLAKEGKGSIAAILPDTTSSTRYVEFDAPYLKDAAQKAGVPITIQNAGGSDQTFTTDAQSDISNGATVLLIDPEDSGTGVAVEKYAASHGVAVVDYDRLSTGGPADDYVSFNNVKVGQLIGTGFESCVTSWGIKKPNVIMMRGAPTDNNATLFYEGYYNDVLASKFKSGAYTLAAQTAGTWTPSDAQTEFETAFSAHPSANSAVIPNDENGAPIITYLKSHGVKPMTFPTTGQDATLTGIQNIISGYQCGTVYKPVYKEAEAAVALALYLRAKKTAPSSLLNGTTKDPTDGKSIPSILLTPTWVTPKTVESTVIADKAIPASQLCAGSYAADCTKYGIS